MSSLKITKLTVSIPSGTDIDLTLDEAKELYDELTNIFGTRTVYVPSSPIIIDRRGPYNPYWIYSTDSVKYTGEHLQVKYTGEKTCPSAY